MFIPASICLVFVSSEAKVCTGEKVPRGRLEGGREASPYPEQWAGSQGPGLFLASYFLYDIFSGWNDLDRSLYAARGEPRSSKSCFLFRARAKGHCLQKS